MAHITVRYTPKDFGSRPEREEIIAVMAELGHSAECTEGSVTTYERDAALEIVSARSLKKIAPWAMVVGGVWLRWDEAAKTTAFAQEVDIPWRELTHMMLSILKRDPGLLDFCIERAADRGRWEAFLGVLVQKLSDDKHPPRGILLRKLVREELATK